ncbi:hypothetical protein A3Q36_13195 [Geobacillus stearothermophilus]|nr:hypothetical protein A3Q36_13195 [Geobacillus stearothermophilus]
MAAWFGTAVCAGFFLTPIRAKERQGHDRGAAGLGKNPSGRRLAASRAPHKTIGCICSLIFGFCLPLML